VGEQESWEADVPFCQRRRNSDRKEEKKKRFVGDDILWPSMMYR
jgi:hypothetical protein